MLKPTNGSKTCFNCVICNAKLIQHRFIKKNLLFQFGRITHFEKIKVVSIEALRQFEIYDKRDDFDFEIVNFPFLDGDVPRSTSYGVYISQLIRFARTSSCVADFNARNKLLTQKLLKQGYRYQKFCKTFSKFYRRYYDLICNSKLDLNLSYAKDFQNLVSMVTWCIS